jgi:hypothetical protein
LSEESAATWDASLDAQHDNGDGDYWIYLNNQPGHILIISCFDVEED